MGYVGMKQASSSAPPAGLVLGPSDQIGLSSTDREGLTVVEPLAEPVVGRARDREVVNEHV